VSNRSVEITPGSRFGPLQLNMPFGRTVSGQVFAPNGVPIGDALIFVRGQRGAFYGRADGSFSLEVPRQDIELQVFANEELTVQRTVEVPSDQDRVRIEMPMVPWGRVAAKVLALVDRKPVAGGILRISSLDGGSADSVRDAQRNIQARWVGTSSGELRLQRFPAGRSRLILHCPGFAPFVREIEVGVNEGRDLGEVLLEPGAYVRGVVRDAAGKPISGARVYLGLELDLATAPAELGVFSGKSGEFLVRGVSADSGQLVVAAEGYATVAHVLEIPDDLLRDNPLPIALNQGSTISVCVASDAENRELSVVVLRRDGNLIDYARTDPDGCVTFFHRSAGTYQVEVLGDASTAKQLEVSGVPRDYDLTIELRPR